MMASECSAFVDGPVPSVVILAEGQRVASWDSVDGAGDRGSLNPKTVHPKQFGTGSRAFTSVGYWHRAQALPSQPRGWILILRVLLAIPETTGTSAGAATFPFPPAFRPHLHLEVSRESRVPHGQSRAPPQLTI